MKSLWKLLLSVLLIHSNLFSQPINEFAAKSYLRTGNSDGYISPFIDVVGSSMNSSGFSYLYDSIQKFHIYVGTKCYFCFHSGKHAKFQWGYRGAFFSVRSQFLTRPPFSVTILLLPLLIRPGDAYVFPGGFGINRVNLLFPSLQNRQLL
jgi:hypothetical protein